MKEFKKNRLTFKLPFIGLLAFAALPFALSVAQDRFDPAPAPLMIAANKTLSHDVKTDPMGMEVGDKTVPWGGWVELKGVASSGREGGACEFSIQYEIINSGSAASPHFTATVFASNLPWKGGEAGNEISPLQPGEKRSVKNTIVLTSGFHGVDLRLDLPEKARELKRFNKVFHIAVSVDCRPRNAIEPVDETALPKPPGL